MAEPLLLAVARVTTYAQGSILTGASGFFYRSGPRLFLVTSRHVVVDSPTGHHPDRLDITVHVDPVDLTRTTTVSLALYEGGGSVWRQGEDSGGPVDVAVVELAAGTIPESVALQAFTESHLQVRFEDVGVGSPLLVVGFPLGFYDTVHHLPVVRHAIVASAFGVRFQGHGYFLTDARTHRGTSGAPVVMRDPDGPTTLPWKLLGIHSAGMDMSTRQLGVDESLGLNCAWYADILRTLTR